LVVTSKINKFMAEWSHRTLGYAMCSFFFTSLALGNAEYIQKQARGVLLCR